MTLQLNKCRCMNLITINFFYDFYQELGIEQIPFNSKKIDELILKTDLAKEAYCHFDYAINKNDNKIDYIQRLHDFIENFLKENNYEEYEFCYIHNLFEPFNEKNELIN